MNDPTPDTTKPTKPKPPAIEVAEPKKPATDSPKSIAVKSLCFFQPHPAFDARNSIASESAENRPRVLIEFIPSLRHHRVERRKVGEPVRVTMVPESLVASWEPLG
jgi:hypothetical protein